MGWYEEGEGRDPGVLGGWGNSTSGDSGGGGWQQSLGKVLSNPYVNMGLGGLGGFLGARAHNQPEQWRQGIVESEIARRNQMQSLALPGMMRAQGYSPGYINAMQGTGVLGGSGQRLNLNSDPSRAGQIGGAVGGVGGTVLGTVLGGKLGGTIGGAIGGTVGQIGNAFGRGRRAANPLVDQVENPFGQTLAKVSQLAGTDPASAKMLLQQAYGQYMNGINQARAMGGQHKKVAEQSLANTKLWDTYKALAQQLGVA